MNLHNIRPDTLGRDSQTTTSAQNLSQYVEDTVWVTALGQHINIRELDDSHIANILRRFGSFVEVHLATPFRRRLLNVQRERIRREAGRQG